MTMIIVTLAFALIAHFLDLGFWISFLLMAEGMIVIYYRDRIRLWLWKCEYYLQSFINSNLTTVCNACDADDTTDASAVTVDTKPKDAVTVDTKPKDAENAARAKWNAEADKYNQWDSLGQDEKDELIANK